MVLSNIWREQWFVVSYWEYVSGIRSVASGGVSSDSVWGKFKSSKSSCCCFGNVYGAYIYTAAIYYVAATHNDYFGADGVYDNFDDSFCMGIIEAAARAGYFGILCCWLAAGRDRLGQLYSNSNLGYCPVVCAMLVLVSGHGPV